jgi:hypothetical protein
MESLFGKSRVNASCRIGLLAIIVVLSSSLRGDNALAQNQTPTQFPQTNGQSNPRPSFGQETETNQDPMFRHAQQEAAKRRNIDRQNKLVANSTRIVQLANELSAGVEPNGKDPTPADMSKKADEIEKLARSVKELMKSD